MFKFTFTLNDDSYYELNKWHNLNSPAGKKNLFRYRARMPLVSLLVISIFLLTNMDLVLVIGVAVVLTVLSFLWIVLAKAMFLKHLRRNINIMKKSGKLPYGGGNTLLFNEDVFVSVAPEKETKVKYSAIERIVETESYIFIFTSSIQAVIIPRSAFSDDAEKVRFIAFLESKKAENPGA